MKHALIKNGTVVNIIVLGHENVNDFPGAVEVEGIPVAVGDAYADGVFYRNGERILTDAEILALLAAEPPEEPQIEP